MRRSEAELEQDVCVGCGKYYYYTQILRNAWRNHFNYREGIVMERLCLSCVIGYAPPHEY